jgi:tRNA dimethylallyltransferase
MPRVIHVLTGCTAVGKTELSLRWAEQRGAEIVSCDSLLFYRGADIGTAKPAPDQLRRVPHHLVDICPVTERMDVTRFLALARGAVEDILGRGRQVLVVGGSGFYLKAFFAPVADDVAVPATIRDEVRAQLEREGLAAVVAALRALNPGGLGDLDVANPRRVTRALERCRAVGRTLAELQADFARLPSAFADCEVRLVELVRAPADLDTRVAERVQAMLTAGLVDEVRGLLAQGMERNPSVAGAIGYRETAEFLAGRMAEAELAPAIVRSTRALVRKQRTWFRTQLPPHPAIEAASAQVGDLFVAPV